MQELIRTVMLICGLVTFGAFSLAVRHHFKSSKMSTGMKLISLLSVIGILVFALAGVRHSQPMFETSTAIILIAMSAALFSWAISATRSHHFRLAYDPTIPSKICTDGPYQHVRHPFYLSYILFWTGACVGTHSATLIAISAMLAILYVRAAFAEEALFSRSHVSEQYVEYCRTTGFILPRVISL